MPTQQEQLKAEIEALKKQLAETKAKEGRTLTCKVSEKGAISVYGMGRFPVTLYKTQWQKLLAFKDEIEKCIQENEARLAVKPVTVAVVKAVA